MRPPINIVLRNYKTRYTGVYEEEYQSTGKLYCFNMRVISGSKDIVLRITSKQKNFKELYSIDIVDKGMNPVRGLEITNSKGKSSADIIEKCVDGLFNKKGTSLKEGDESPHFDWSSIMQLAVAAASFLLFIRYVGVKFKNWWAEKSANRAENDLNKQLFGNQDPKSSEFHVYNKLINAINMVIRNNKVKSLIICGIPGTSKTYIVRRTFYFNRLTHGKEYVILKGSTLTLNDFCSILYKNSDKIIIFDDFDTPLEDKELVNILKSATDSYSHRIISVPRAKEVGNQNDTDIDLPEKFEFNGKILIITNKKFRELDKALISRSLTVEVNFKPEEFVEAIHNMLKYIMPDVDMKIKEEVLDFISELVQKRESKGLNFRTFQNAITIRLLYDNWKDMIKYVLK